MHLMYCNLLVFDPLSLRVEILPESGKNVNGSGNLNWNLERGPGGPHHHAQAGSYGLRYHYSIIG